MKVELLLRWSRVEHINCKRRALSKGGLLLEGYLNFDIKRYLLGIWKNFVDVVWLRFFFSCFVMTWAFKNMRTYLRLNELNKVSIKGLRSISTLRP